MNRNIKISPKHGLNPTCCICFFCGESKAIALLGKLKDDAEAPKKMIMDYKPCTHCLEKFGDNIVIIEVSLTPIEGRPPITNEAWPTGRWCVISPETSKELFNTPAPKSNTILLEDSVFDKLFRM